MRKAYSARAEFKPFVVGENAGKRHPNKRLDSKHPVTGELSKKK